MAFLSAFLLGLQSFAASVPATPPNACYEGCTPFMQNLLTEFQNLGKSPQLQPAVYSGVCHHLGEDNPDVEHYAVVFIDQVNSQPQFSTIFSFFAEGNDYLDWSVQKARESMSPYWIEHGKMHFEENTARVIVNYEDGNPAYIYWLRQNPQTNDLLYITYAGHVMKSFCRLNKNNNE